VLDIAKNSVSKCKIYTIGIGSGVSMSLVEGLAKNGNGSCKIVKNMDLIRETVVSSLIEATRYLKDEI